MTLLSSAFASSPTLSFLPDTMHMTLSELPPTASSVLAQLLVSWFWLVEVWTSMVPDKNSMVNFIPFTFRILAFLIATPFAVCIALDAIAYGIARTLHLSISARRVPRSPLSKQEPILETT